jgi:hypothetical protein
MVFSGRNPQPKSFRFVLKLSDCFFIFGSDYFAGFSLAKMDEANRYKIYPQKCDPFFRPVNVGQNSILRVKKVCFFRRKASPGLQTFAPLMLKTAKLGRCGSGSHLQHLD